MSAYNTDKASRLRKGDAQDKERIRKEQELRKLIDDTAKRWQPEHDKVARDDERW